MKIEIAQITTYPGDIKHNTIRIIDCISQARKKGVDLIVFPELTIPGYLSMDLFLYVDYLEANQRALQQIIPHTGGITAIVGFVDTDITRIGPDGTHLRYNSAAVIQNGRLLGVEDKTLLPDYDVFNELRYFQSARGHRLYSCAGKKIGIEICEDLWDDYYPVKVSRELVKKGAEILINISASPFYLNKGLVREKLIQKIVRRYHLPFIYANLVGSFDGYEGQLVFDGQSMAVSSTGKIITRGRAFEEQSLIVNPDQLISVELNNTETIAQLYQALVLGIKQYFQQNGFRQAFIGLSGGVDSALVASLTAAALGPKNVTGVCLPSTLTSSESQTDAHQLAQNLNINFKTIPISLSHSVLSKQLNPGDLTNQNIQARLRGLILMSLANENQGLVITTGNKTETALGYCTLYGDMAGALAPISDVDKLKVYQLARYINEQNTTPIIPINTLLRPPTAELSANQTDEAGLGASYDLIVPIVNQLIESRATVSELSQKFPRNLVEKYWRLIRLSEHKRRQAAPGIKVTAKSFGVGRRIPISHQFIT